MIGQERSLYATWPGEKVIRDLVQSASGLFIWAAIACRFIHEGKFAEKRLATILQGSVNAVNAPEKHLDNIYTTVLEHSIAAEYTDEEKEESYYMLRHILGSIAILFSPLSASSLSMLLPVKKEDMDQTLVDLHSVLDVPIDQTLPFRLHHSSFRDFILNSDRCKNPNLWVDEKRAHKTLADSCIQLMSNSLKQDICNLNTPGVLVNDVPSCQVELSIPPEVQYACLYWVQHFLKSGVQLRDDYQVHQFLQGHLLHWLEALSYMQKVSEGVNAIFSLESIAAACNCPRLSEFIYDTKRFILYNRSIVEQAPLQAYSSALVFAPAMSIVKKRFKDCVPRWIRRPPEVESNWSAILQTLEGHRDWVTTVRFSPDGMLLASASYDNNINLWNASSGAIMQTLDSYRGCVYAVAFSPDGKLLASASEDKAVQLWDVSLGTLLQTLEGHSEAVRAVAFSLDGKLLLSASDDKTIKLWNVGSRVPVVLQTLEGHSSRVSAISISSDGKLLASASYDNTVKLWDISLRVILQTLNHAGKVLSVTFSPSPSSKLLASASANHIVNLLDINSEKALQTQTLGDYSRAASDLAFSPNGKILASASNNGTVKVWDVSSGAVLQTLEGHLQVALGVAFSPDGKLRASASADKTVKLWGTSLITAPQAPIGHLSWVCNIAFSPDGAFLQTNRGSLHSAFLSDRAGVSRSNLPHSIFVKKQWVSLDMENVLWLPPDYRPHRVAVHGNIVVFGYKSGRVLFMEFDFEHFAKASP